MSRWQWRRMMRISSLGLAGCAVAVLVAACSGTHDAGQIPPASPSPADHAQQSEQTPPATQPPANGLVRFSDTVNHTKFAVQTDMMDPNAGVFNFVTPTGAQYHGGQASDLQQMADNKTMLSLSYQGMVQVYPPAADGQSVNSSTVTITLTASIDLVQRQATADLTDTTTKQHFSLRTQIPGHQLQAVQEYNGPRNLALRSFW